MLRIMPCKVLWTVLIFVCIVTVTKCDSLEQNLSELEELDMLIELQKKKLALLNKMKQEDCDPEAGCDYLADDDPTVGGVLDEEAQITKAALSDAQETKKIITHQQESRESQKQKLSDSNNNRNRYKSPNQEPTDEYYDDEDMLPALGRIQGDITSAIGLSIRLPRRKARNGGPKRRDYNNVVNLVISADVYGKLHFVEFSETAPTKHLMSVDIEPAIKNGAEEANDEVITVTAMHTVAGVGKSEGHLMIGLSDGRVLMYSVNAWIEHELASSTSSSSPSPSSSSQSSTPVSIEDDIDDADLTAQVNKLQQDIDTSNNNDNGDHVLDQDQMNSGLYQRVTKLKLIPEVHLGSYDYTPAFYHKVDQDDEEEEDKEGLVVVPPREGPGRTRAVTHVHIYKKRRYKMLAVAYDDGALRVFTANGTIRSELDTRNTTIHQMKTNDNQQLLVATDAGLGLVRLSKNKKKMDAFCSMRNITQAQVKSIAFDPIQNNLLYAATDDGELLILPSIIRRRKEFCSLKIRVKVASGQELSVDSVKGYVFLTSSTELYVYNVTMRGRKHRPQFAMQRQVTLLSSSSRALSLQTFQSFYKTDYLVISSGKEVVPYQSYLPYQEPSGGFGMMRAPLFIGGLVLVVVYQVYKKKKAASGGGMGMGMGGGGMPNFNDPNFLQGFNEWNKRNGGKDFDMSKFGGAGSAGLGGARAGGRGGMSGSFGPGRGMGRNRAW